MAFSSVKDSALLQKYLEMAGRRFPGADYYEALRAIHGGLRPRTYIEIGVRHGASLACALPGTRCIGVDPDPCPALPLPPDTCLVRATSDEFFALGDGLADSFDLAFIDGLHRFEQALRDFIALERLAHRGSVILIHDCIPLDEIASARSRTTDFYCGDVWKLPVCLRERRPDLRQAVIPAAPSGLCAVWGLDPGSRTLRDGYDRIVAEYAGVAFAAYTPSAAEIANDPERIREWAEGLRARCAARGDL